MPHPLLGYPHVTIYLAVIVTLLSEIASLFMCANCSHPRCKVCTAVNNKRAWEWIYSLIGVSVKS